MKRQELVSWVGLILVVVLGVVVLMKGNGEKKAFIVNQNVFEGYKGTKELESKLQALKKRHAAILDSLAVGLKEHASHEALKHYQQVSSEHAQKEQQLSESYTAELWKRINQGVSDYGKEKGYDFIFGAAGNGSLMYAKESVDVTDEVVQYLNDKY